MLYLYAIYLEQTNQRNDIVVLSKIYLLAFVLIDMRL